MGIGMDNQPKIQQNITNLDAIEKFFSTIGMQLKEVTGRPVIYSNHSTYGPSIFVDDQMIFAASQVECIKFKFKSSSLTPVIVEGSNSLIILNSGWYGLAEVNILGDPTYFYRDSNYPNQPLLNSDGIQRYLKDPVTTVDTSTTVDSGGYHIPYQYTPLYNIQSKALSGLKNRATAQDQDNFTYADRAAIGNLNKKAYNGDLINVPGIIYPTPETYNNFKTGIMHNKHFITKETNGDIICIGPGYYIVYRTDNKINDFYYLSTDLKFEDSYCDKIYFDSLATRPQDDKSMLILYTKFFFTEKNGYNWRKINVDGIPTDSCVNIETLGQSISSAEEKLVNWCRKDLLINAETSMTYISDKWHEGYCGYHDSGGRIDIGSRTAGNYELSTTYRSYSNARLTITASQCHDFEFNTDQNYIALDNLNPRIKLSDTQSLLGSTQVLDTTINERISAGDIETPYVNDKYILPSDDPDNQSYGFITVNGDVSTSRFNKITQQIDAFCFVDMTVLGNTDTKGYTPGYTAQGNNSATNPYIFYAQKSGIKYTGASYIESYNSLQGRSLDDSRLEQYNMFLSSEYAYVLYTNFSYFHALRATNNGKKWRIGTEKTRLADTNYCYGFLYVPSNYEKTSGNISPCDFIMQFGSHDGTSAGTFETSLAIQRKEQSVYPASSLLFDTCLNVNRQLSEDEILCDNKDDILRPLVTITQPSPLTVSISITNLNNFALRDFRISYSGSGPSGIDFSINAGETIQLSGIGTASTIRYGHIYQKLTDELYGSSDDQ